MAALCNGRDRSIPYIIREHFGQFRSKQKIFQKIFAFVKINILYLQYIRNLNILKA